MKKSFLFLFLLILLPLANAELNNYPLILIHGHAITIGEAKNFLTEYKEKGSFKQLENFQIKLDKDNLYENKNVILPSHDFDEICTGSWNKKISARTTYYVDFNGNFDDHASIEEYSERVGKVVEIVKKCANSNKVDLAGYSMGGLVAREYARNYPENVNKIITIGTPNFGFSEKLGPKTLCSAFRHDYDIECREMEENSNFIKKLNSYEFKDTYTISGILKNRDILGLICTKHGGCNDGVVCTKLSIIPKSKNYIIYAEKPSEDLKYIGSGIHYDLIDPETKSGNEVYKIVKEILNNKEPLANENELENKCRMKQGYIKLFMENLKNKLKFLLIN